MAHTKSGGSVKLARNVRTRFTRPLGRASGREPDRIPASRFLLPSMIGLAGMPQRGECLSPLAGGGMASQQTAPSDLQPDSRSHPDMGGLSGGAVAIGVTLPAAR